MTEKKLYFDILIKKDTKLFTYYLVPKPLVQNKFFNNVTLSAKFLYSILADRASLSKKNEWKDENGRIFIIYTIEKMVKDSLICKSKIHDLLNNLENTGLIKRVKRGFGEPNLIYVNDYTKPMTEHIKTLSDKDFLNGKFASLRENETEFFSYFVIPKYLVQNESFKDLSIDSKFLYSIFLDRVSISEEKGWQDKNGRTFIYYPLAEIAVVLGIGKNKTIELLDELENFKLIKRVRQGLRKPNKIYLMDFRKQISYEQWKEKFQNIKHCP